MNALIKNAIIIGVGVVACLAIFFGLLMPALTHVNNLNMELVVQKTELVNLDQQIRAYKTAESDLKKAVDKQDILDAIVAKESSVVPIQEVEAGIQNSDSTDEVLSIDDTFALSKAKGAKKDQTPIVTGLNGVVLVPYTLSAKNDYAGMINLFSYLEHLPHFTELSSFKLEAQYVLGSGSDTKAQIHTGKIQATIQGVFFAKKDATTNN